MRALWPLVLVFSMGMTACDAPPADDAPSEEIGDGEDGGGGGASALQVYAKYANDTNTSTKIIVSGVTSGQTVHLFSGTSCGAEISSATANGTSVAFNVSGLAIGAHSFSAKTSGGACSTLNATYTRVGDCPSGYVKVEGDNVTGIKPFCVMQFEAKNVSGVPTSQAAGTPWSSISANDIKAKCRTLGADYDLISSLEWQTITRDVEQQEINWERSPGADMMAMGRSVGEGGTNTAIAVSDSTNPWSDITYGSVPSTLHQFRRTLHLSNGSVVWDMAGNADEFVDYGMASTYTSPPGCSGSDVNSAYIVRDHGTCANTPSQHFMTFDETADYRNGYGSVRTLASGGTLTRGGGNLGGSGMVHVGIGSWAMTIIDPADSTTSSATVAFRCVKRLNPVPAHTRTVAMSLRSTTSINFTGTQPGETYTLSTNAMCTNNVGSVKATSSTATANVTMPAAGTYNLFFKVTSSDGSVGPCFPHSVSYEYRACPNGFLLVPGNSARGVADFCAMKYEARKNGSAISVDLADGYWDSAWASQGKAACENLNTYPHTNISMMTNDEWMTIADNVYAVASNWSTGIVGLGFMPSGVSNQSAAAATTTPSNAWSGVEVGGMPTTDFKYRRTLRLSTGEDIWDLNGNLEEHVEYGTPSGSTTPTAGPSCNALTNGPYEELQNAVNSCPGLPSAQIMPVNPALGSSAGMGQFYPYEYGAVISRGGSYSRGVAASGIYTYRGRTGNDVNEGIRCVYRP